VTPCPYSRKFSNGVLFVCTLEANHKGGHLMWKASRKARYPQAGVRSVDAEPVEPGGGNPPTPMTGSSHACNTRGTRS